MKHRQGAALYKLGKHSESMKSMLIDPDFTKQVRAQCLSLLVYYIPLPLPYQGPNSSAY